MSYKLLQDAARDEKTELRIIMRKAELYKRIYKNTAAIVEVLFPSDKALVICTNLKSIAYAWIELKTGRKPEKF